MYKQPLLSRSKTPIPFCEWAAKPKTRVCYPETAIQLFGTFYSVSLIFGIRLRSDLTNETQFQQACLADGNAYIQAPRLYLSCCDDNSFLVFHWQRWLESVDYITGGPIDAS